ncbi:acyl-CoA dehydrogenase family protein [Pseudonocardia sp.]|uniref:acyl-CoA dehydrogenase family protein n=1 Tax=Pseudonocardia sp. TaxID=60912 RepID=UPI003D0FA244
MAWDFETDGEYAERLGWADRFVREEVEPLDLVLGSPFDKSNPDTVRVLEHLRTKVKQQGLWACHLGPELGGQGFGQVKLALLNEILGRSSWAPSVFGSQAPDSGNAEILARFGTEEQKANYLYPLLDGRIASCYSMTEPQAGSDPALFTTSARRDGDDWVIDGEKWFQTNARYAAFFIVMALTDPDAGAHHGMSLFIVPAGTPGLEIVRHVGVGTEAAERGEHAYLRLANVRVRADDMLGDEGEAFAIAQTRLGGGRIHHAMRTIGMARQAFDMMCERAVSRRVRSGTLGDLQMTQERIADSWIEIEQFRLLVLRTAWLIDKHQDYRRVRGDISAVKVAMAKVAHDVVLRSLHLHGSIGISNEMPFSRMLVDAETMALADGPTEVHKQVLARQVLRHYTPSTTLFPAYHLPSREAAARRHLDGLLEHVVAQY